MLLCCAVQCCCIIYSVNSVTKEGKAVLLYNIQYTVLCIIYSVYSVTKEGKAVPVEKSFLGSVSGTETL